MLIEAVTQTTEGHVYILTGNDDLNIGAGVAITSNTTDAITMWQGTHIITVAGSITGYDDGINTIGCDTAQTITIQSTGLITSGGDGVIPDADGVILDGLNSVLVNHGTIHSYGSAASLFVRDLGTTTVTNTGSMSGDRYGIWNKFGSGTLEFTNSGTVESLVTAYYGGNFVDHVTNSGLMIGNVDLNGGNDRYDGRGGSVAGAINGGDGDDLFILGLAAETIDGGLGIDTLDFSHVTNRITVDLTGVTANAGATVLGDTYTNVENLTGGTMGDRLTGTAEANVLIGNGGNDLLIGGDGLDHLEGGRGKDVLNGGAGIDWFVFTAKNAMTDTIQDFTHGVDQIRLVAAAFGYSTTTGALAEADFVISATNAALDASDHFILRNTDNTLWFDRDGTGRAAAVLVADLQDGATLLAADIWLF